MKKHFNSYEQYCSVFNKNIIMQVTVFHNGTKRTVCTNLPTCNKVGGCKNVILRKLWDDIGTD